MVFTGQYLEDDKHSSEDRLEESHGDGAEGPNGLMEKVRRTMSEAQRSVSEEVIAAQGLA